MKKLNHIDIHSEAGYAGDPLIPAVLFAVTIVIAAVAGWMPLR